MGAPWGLVPASVIKTAVAHLTSAQILNMFAVPVTVLAAPGPGKRIFIIGASMVYNFVTTAYAGGTQPQLCYAANITTLGNAPFVAVAGVLTNVSNFVTQMTRGAVGATGQAGAVTTNQAIVITLNAAATTGDGTIDLYLEYVILPSPP